MEKILDMVRNKIDPRKIPSPREAKEFIKDLIEELENIIEGLNIDIKHQEDKR